MWYQFGFGLILKNPENYFQINILTPGDFSEVILQIISQFKGNVQWSSTDNI